MPNEVKKDQVTVAAPVAFNRIGGQPLDYTAVFKSYNDAIVYAADPNGQAYIGQVISVAKDNSGVGDVYVVVGVKDVEDVIVEGVAYPNYLRDIRARVSLPHSSSNETIPVTAAASGEVYGVPMTGSGKANSIPRLDGSGRLKVNSDADISGDKRYVPSRAYVEDKVYDTAAYIENKFYTEISDVKRMISYEVETAQHALSDRIDGVENGLIGGSIVPHLSDYSNYINNNEGMYKYWDLTTPTGKSYTLAAERGTLLCVTCLNGSNEWRTQMLQLGITGRDVLHDSDEVTKDNHTYRSSGSDFFFKEDGDIVPDMSEWGPEYNGVEWNRKTMVYGTFETSGDRISFRVVWGKIYRIIYT